MGTLQRDMMKHGLPPNGAVSRMPGAPAKKLPQKRSFEPLSWEAFFDEKRFVTVGKDTFNVYLKGCSGPIFFLLHGGGYSGLTWACLATELLDRVDCRVVAPDLRGHGKSACENEEDLSMERQTKDISAIWECLFPSSSSSFSSPEEHAAVIVVGHSMGGALAVHLVQKELIKSATVAGLVVIDVVEGTAMEALGMMSSFLSSRPASFESEEAAVKWCLQSGTVRNSKAARVSMPAQVRLHNEDNRFHWRIDLRRSEPHWIGWFSGLSQAFVRCPPAKMLVLAGTDRLDKDLMIAQMQGKFQTTVLPRVGHAVQEDSPDRLADELARFIIRHKLATAKGGMQFNIPTC